MLSQEIIKTLIHNPTVLLLGQKYLQMGTGEDTFLAETFRKFGPAQSTQPPSYNSLLKLGLEGHVDDVTAWFDKLGKYINPPASIARIASIPWSAVLTSAIDPGLPIQLVLFIVMMRGEMAGPCLRDRMVQLLLPIRIKLLW